MNVMEIFQTLRRHWVVSTLVLCLTAASAGWIFVEAPRSYEISSSYVLNFPVVEAGGEIVPGAASNPFLFYEDSFTVAQALAARVGGGSVRSAIAAEGTTGSYQVFTSAELNASRHLLYVEVSGATRAQVDQTLRLLDASLVRELNSLQLEAGAQGPLFVTLTQAAIPDEPDAVVTGVIRSMVAAVAAGLVVLVLAASAAEGWAQRKARSLRRRRSRAATASQSSRRQAAASQSPSAEEPTDPVSPRTS